MARRNRLKESGPAGDGGKPAKGKVRTKPKKRTRDQAHRALKAHQSRKGDLRKINSDLGDVSNAEQFIAALGAITKKHERAAFKSAIAMPREANGEEILATLAYSSGIIKRTEKPSQPVACKTSSSSDTNRPARPRPELTPAANERRRAGGEARARPAKALPDSAIGIAADGLAEADVSQIAAILNERAAPSFSVSVASDIKLARLHVRWLMQSGIAHATAEDRKYARKARLQIFLDEIDASPQLGSLNAGSRFSASEHAWIVGLNGLARRHGRDRILAGAGFSAFGLEVIADAIQIAAAQEKILPGFPDPIDRPAPGDLIEARELALAPLDLLSRLSWDASSPPKLIKAQMSRPALEAFADSQIALENRKSIRLLPAGETIDWNRPLENEQEATSFLGLGFLSSVLLYWYVKASGTTSDKLGPIDAVLKQKNVTASALLARSGAVIADFVEKCPPSKMPAAWTRAALTQRAKVLLLFLLACRAAAKRRIRFDAALCTPAFLGLLDVIEFLRNDSGRAIGTEAAISHIGFLVGVALPLRRTTYGRALLEECFDHFARFHLASGLSQDGVWRGTFEEHCGTLKAAATLLTSVRAMKLSAAPPVSAAAERMTAFVEAMLRGNNLPPPIDHTAPVSHEKTLKFARAALSVPGVKPIEPRLTYVLAESGYFISHTRGDRGPASSQLAMHATAGDIRHKRPGRLSLSFCVGDMDLVIGGGALSRKVPKDIVASARTDLASGNEYRVNGTSYGASESVASDAIALERGWEGRGWAAAAFINRAHTGGRIRRTAIHLKPVHALLVMDELTSKGGSEITFDQFWHLAPDLLRQGEALQFATAAPGCLSVAFDSGAVETEVLTPGTPQDSPISWGVSRTGEPEAHPVIRRRLVTKNGLAVSLFQWTREPAPLGLRRGELQGDGWVIEAVGKSFEVRFALSGDELARLDKAET